MWDQVKIQGDEGGSSLALRVKTGAESSRIIGPYGDRVKIAVDEPPVDGKANDRLREMFADIFHLSVHEVLIQSGEGSSDKHIRLEGRSPERVRKLLERYATD